MGVVNGPRGAHIWAWGGAWGVQLLRGFLRRNIPVPARHVSTRGASRQTKNDMLSSTIIILHFWTGLTTLTKITLEMLTKHLLLAKL